MFRSELDAELIGEIRIAMGQGQPLGNACFLDRIEKAMGYRREARPRGRPKKSRAQETGEGELRQISMEL